MKQQVDPRVFIAVVAVLVLVVGFFAFRSFAPRGNGATVSAQDAGLGKPVYPNIPPQQKPAGAAAGQGQ